jgi:hypothetical protein
MANIFKNLTAESTIAGTVVYTVPANTTAIAVGLNVANKTASAEAISVDMNGVFLVKDIPLPTGSAVSLLDGKIVFTENDVITVSSITDASCDVIMSVMEQS